MLENPAPTPEPNRERWHIERLARLCKGQRQLADRVAGTSEETASLFDSGYRPQSERGENPHNELP